MAPCAAVPRQLSARPSLAVLLHVTLALLGPRGAWADMSDRKYLITTFPDLKQVAYMHIPTNVWMPLVGKDVTEFISPQAVAADNENQRIYVADPTAMKIYWYNINHLDDGRIETNQIEHVAVENMTVSGMVTDTVGNLYYAGKPYTPPPGTSNMAIYKLSALDIATGKKTGSTLVWTRSNTGQPDPSLWMPSGLAVDAFSMYWGNQEAGETHGAVVKASGQSRAASSMLHVQSLVANTEMVNALVRTPQTLFYATSNGIYSVSSDKTESGCGAKGALCPLVSSKPTNTQGMAYDMDGTVYLADNSLRAIYSFPSGSKKSPVTLLKVADARSGTGGGPWGLAVYTYDTDYTMYGYIYSGGMRPVAGATVFLAAIVAALAAAA